MKLNKPPLTHEQSILEEYVEFLLTDLSNVHPIKVESKTKISDLIVEKESRSPHVKEAKSVEVKNVTKRNKVESQASIEEAPKWSTIEKAASKRQKKFKPENKQSENKQSENTGESIQVGQPEVIQTSEPLEAPSNLHQYIEESEEIQLKQWDALITAEKEQKILANELDDKVSENQSSAKFKSDAKIASDENSVATKAKKLKATKVAQQNVQELTQQTREIIESYLPPEAQQDPRLASVEKLLSRISLATLPKVLPVNEKTHAAPQREAQAKIDAQQVAEVAQATFMHRQAQRSRDILPEVFQTLIFQVAALPMAVPLIKLGGIMKISDEDITPLVGTPGWFMGLVPHDKGNLMVVDTQRFLMPEKGVGGVREDYQYLILLDNSNWALACNSVGDAKNLTQDDIRWAQKSSRRPWFAGMVVDYMSALLEVDELINMLADNIVD